MPPARMARKAAKPPMVFLIQATRNRDAEAVQVRLDELLCATAGAHNACWTLKSSKSANSTKFAGATGAWPRVPGQTCGRESGTLACLK
jgi:hypothetical protein